MLPPRPWGQPSIHRRPLGFLPLLLRPACSRKPPSCFCRCAISIILLQFFSTDPLLKPEKNQQSIPINTGLAAPCTASSESEQASQVHIPGRPRGHRVLYVRCSEHRFTDGNIYLVVGHEVLARGDPRENKARRHYYKSGEAQTCPDTCPQASGHTGHLLPPLTAFSV